MNHDRKTGVLLANLGTPAAPDRKSVARFLREFLSDPRVVDLPRYLWLPLLNLVIIPIRSGRSASAYRKVWRTDGSPLLVFTKRLEQGLRKHLGSQTPVETGMRYGEPSIYHAMTRLRDRGCDDVIVLPLYPQFSHTTTSSIFDAVDQSMEQLSWQAPVHKIDDYHQDPTWVKTIADSIRSFQAVHGKPDCLMFSLHGIPQRYVTQGDPYASQCEASVEAIATELGLSEKDWKLCFQSRVGREPWLQPYTDKSLEEMAEKGVRHVQVVCPGFAVDCLETLEEIAMENRDLFLEAGGEKLEYVPALNDSPEHAECLVRLLQSAMA